MLRAGAGTLVTPALGSVVSRWASAPQHVVHPSLVTETKARPLLFFFLPSDHRLGGLAVGACTVSPFLW